MAKIFPPHERTDSPDSEKRVRRSLASLGDQWTVMHSVRWQSARNGRQGDGEADFVLLHPAHGILILEVKGGEVELLHGSWFSTNRDGRHPIKDPFEQATASKHALLKYLQECGIDMRSISVGHAVALPHITLTSSRLGPAAPPEITWDRAALQSIASYLSRTIHHWRMSARLSEATVRRITDLLMPTYRIRRRLIDEVSDAHAALVELTDRQIWAFAQIRGVRNALVTGGAGTGKTILAIERARQLAKDGFRTLVVCYNELLGRLLAEEFSLTKLVHASTYHSLCMSECRRAGIDSTPRADDPKWWEDRAPDLLMSAVWKTGTTFDAIIIDEGQDFSQAWLDSLEAFTMAASTPPRYVFADSHQHLYRRTWTVPDSWPRIELDLNCRSTRQIVEKVSAIFAEPSNALGANGPTPRFYPYDHRRHGAGAIQEFVARLISEEGLQPERIVVLSDEAAFVLRLRELLAGDHPFVEFGKLGVVTETIARFKGLEADAVVVALGRFACLGEHWRSTIYTALSRAKTALFVFGSKEQQSAMKWS